MTDSISTNSSNKWAMICHLSALALYVFPLGGNLIGPAIVYFARRDVDPSVQEHGRHSLNFQLTLSVIFAVCILGLVAAGLILGLLSFKWPGSESSASSIAMVFGMLGGTLAFGFLTAVLGLWNLILIFINAIRAYDGRSPEYWPVYEFIRSPSKVTN